MLFARVRQARHARAYISAASSWVIFMRYKYYGVGFKTLRPSATKSAKLLLHLGSVPAPTHFRGPSTRSKMRHTQSLRKSEQRRRLFSGTFVLSPMLARGRRLAPPTTIVQTDCPTPQGRRKEKAPHGCGASPESSASPWGTGRAANIPRIADCGLSPI